MKCPRCHKDDVLVLACDACGEAFSTNHFDPAELLELIEKAKAKLLNYRYTTEWIKASSKMVALDAVAAHVSGDFGPLKELAGKEE